MRRCEVARCSINVGDSSTSACDRHAGTWFELSTWADNEAIESVAELLARFGYNEGVSIEQPFLQEQDGDNLTIDTPNRRSYAPTCRLNRSTRRSSSRFATDSGTSARCAAWASDADGAARGGLGEAWKEHYRPMRASDRVVIRPPWFDYAPQPDDIVLVLDPGHGLRDRSASHDAPEPVSD